MPAATAYTQELLSGCDLLCNLVLLCYVSPTQAVVQLSLGQASGSQEQLKAAQQYFQLVGSSPTECDTIPGRQAMASCFFLLKQFEDVLVFLNVSNVMCWQQALLAKHCACNRMQASIAVWRRCPQSTQR